MPDLRANAQLESNGVKVDANVEPLDERRPTRGADVAREHVDGRRLARTGGEEKGR